ncbi:MAG: hypothetical protein J6D03_06225 [Clostridia bacterium]|nr:hypothetical protein [Clostridia bacterium]
MNKNKIIIVSVIILLIIAIIGILFVVFKGEKNEEKQQVIQTKQEEQIKNVDTYIGELSDGTKINTNAKMNTPSNLGNLSIDNIRLTLKNGITTFRANVTNKGESATKLKKVKLSLTDKDGKELVKANGIIQEIKEGEAKEIAISITSDYINACGYKLIEDE